MEIVLLVFTTYFVTAFWNCCQAETSSNGIADSSVKNNVETRMRELESQVDRLKREIQTMRNTGKYLLCLYADVYQHKSFRSRGYKTFFVLNLIEHEILNAHTLKNIKKFGFL